MGHPTHWAEQQEHHVFILWRFPPGPGTLNQGASALSGLIKTSLLKEWVLRAESSKIRIPEQKQIDSCWKPESSPGCLSVSLIVQLLLDSLKCIIIIIIYLSSLRLFFIIAIRIRRTQIHSLTQFTTPCLCWVSIDSENRLWNPDQSKHPSSA